MKNSADLGGCCPQNSLAAILFIQNISPFLKEFCHFALCFFCSSKITQPRTQAS